jgi:hypothetical protein
LDVAFLRFTFAMVFWGRWWNDLARCLELLDTKFGTDLKERKDGGP